MNPTTLSVVPRKAMLRLGVEEGLDKFEIAGEWTGTWPGAITDAQVVSCCSTVRIQYENEVFGHWKRVRTVVISDCRACG